MKVLPRFFLGRIRDSTVAIIYRWNFMAQCVALAALGPTERKRGMKLQIQARSGAAIVTVKNYRRDRQVGL